MRAPSRPRTPRTEWGAGKYIGAPGIFFSWLEPIYNGLNARLTAGLHAGCLRLVVGKDSQYHRLADLKGTTIGVSYEREWNGREPNRLARNTAQVCRRVIATAISCRVSRRG